MPTLNTFLRVRFTEAPYHRAVDLKDLMEAARFSRERVQVDSERARMDLRPGPEHAWVQVPLFRQVRQTVLWKAHVFVAWAGPEDASGQELPVVASTPQVSAYELRGRLLWTLTAEEVPFFAREGARSGGVVSVSLVAGGDVRLGSGPWFCVVEDVLTPRLGPLQHTG